MYLNREIYKCSLHVDYQIGKFMRGRSLSTISCIFFIVTHTHVRTFFPSNKPLQSESFVDDSRGVCVNKPRAQARLLNYTL